jgi:Beta-galactosidase
MLRRLLISLFFVCGFANAALKDTAYGIYSLTKVADPLLEQDASWTNPNITGVVIRTWWKYVQPTQGTYDWSYIDKGVALAQQNNKKIAISIVAGLTSPAWIYSLGAQKFTIQGDGVMPCPWNSVFQSYWQQLVLAFGTRYDSVASVSCVTAGGLGRKEECYLCKTINDVQELNNDGGVAIWIQAGETIAGFYSQAFPTTPFVYADGTPIPGDNTDYGTVVTYCVNTFGPNFGIKSDGLYAGYHLKSYGGQEIPALSPNHPVGFQDVRRFGDPTKLQGALNMGIQLKAHFIEVKTQDVTAADDQTIIADAQSQLTGQ